LILSFRIKLAQHSRTPVQAPGGIKKSFTLFDALAPFGAGTTLICTAPLIAAFGLGKF
jgi:hypothetical protein